MNFQQPARGISRRCHDRLVCQRRWRTRLARAVQQVRFRELVAPILVAADEDYVPLVEAVKRDGRRVVHAFLDVPNFGRRLRMACDDFRVITEVDLNRLVSNGA